MHDKPKSSDLISLVFGVGGVAVISLLLGMAVLLWEQLSLNRETLQQIEGLVEARELDLQVQSETAAALEALLHEVKSTNALTRSSLAELQSLKKERQLEVALRENIVEALEALEAVYEEQQISAIRLNWELLTSKAAGNSGKVQALEFLASRGESLDRINLSCAILGEVRDIRGEARCIRRVFLEGLDLSEGTIGRQVSLHRAILNGTNLRNAQLRGVDLSVSALIGSDLQNADVSRAKLRAVNLRAAELEGANFSKSIMTHAGLEGANLKEARLRNAVLDNARMRQTDLSDAKFYGASMNDVDLTGSLMTNANFYGVSFKNADLENTRMSGADLRETNLNGTDFGGAYLLKVKFRGASITGADFRNAIGVGTADFANAHALLSNPPRGLPKSIRKCRQGKHIYYELTWPRSNCQPIKD